MCPSVPSSQLLCTHGCCFSSILPQEDGFNVPLLSGYGKGAGSADLPSTLTLTGPLAGLCTLNHDLHRQHQLSTPNSPLNCFRPLCLIQLAKVEASTVLSLASVPHASAILCTEGRSAVSTEPWGGKLGHLLGLPPLPLTIPFVPSLHTDITP